MMNTNNNKKVYLLIESSGSGEAYFAYGMDESIEILGIYSQKELAYENGNEFIRKNSRTQKRLGPGNDSVSLQSGEYFRGVRVEEKDFDKPVR